MGAHLHREIDRLKKILTQLCGVVEEQVQLAVQALLERDEGLARRVIAKDRAIDQSEVDIEEECLKTLALHQPVATDLRLIVAALKINNDLERMGDLAVNIANKALRFSEQPHMEIPFDLEGMGRKTQAMLRDSLDSLISLNAELAADVCTRDDEVDDMKRDIRERAEILMSEQPERITSYLILLAVSRNLERIADHATNIAEDVVYMVEGRIIRHGEGDVTMV